MLLLGAAGLGATPSVKEYGWARLTPTTVLISLIPAIECEKDPIRSELYERLNVETWRYSSQSNLNDLGLWSWQRRLLAARCETAIGTDSSRAARKFALSLLRALGPEAESAIGALVEVLSAQDKQLVWLAARVIENMGPSAYSATPALVELLAQEEHHKEFFIGTVIRALGNIGPEARSAVPVLVRIVEAGSGNYWFGPQRHIEAVRALGSIGPDAGKAIPVLVRLAADEESPARAIAITAIGDIDSSPSECREVILLALRDPEVSLRGAARSVVCQDRELVEFVVQRLAGHLYDTDSITRAGAARGLMTLATAAVPAVPDLREALKDEDAIVRLFAVRALASMDHKSSTTREAVRTATSDPDSTVSREAARALESMSTVKEHGHDEES